ncbi:MAG: pseudouridine synthase [Bacteroidota bacterium]
MDEQQYRYFILNKPSGMESQFVSPYEGPLLGDIDFDFPEGTHAIGRLDKNSEGLLLLTTNKKITKLLFEINRGHERTYLVQVRHKVNAENLQRLRSGVNIRIRGGHQYTSLPVSVNIVDAPVDIFPSPFQIHKNVKTTWLQITLTEGKYHQVRKMVAAAGHRCIRLIRISIENLLLGDLQPGKIKEMSEEDFFGLLKLKIDVDDKNKKAII